MSCSWFWDVIMVIIWGKASAVCLDAWRRGGGRSVGRSEGPLCSGIQGGGGWITYDLKTAFSGSDRERRRGLSGRETSPRFPLLGDHALYIPSAFCCMCVFPGREKVSWPKKRKGGKGTMAARRGPRGIMSLLQADGMTRIFFGR